MVDVAEKHPGCPDLDLHSDEAIQCPYPFYEQLRQEAPVYFYKKGGYYVVSKMADVRDASTKTDIFSSEIVHMMGMTPKTAAVVTPVPTLILADPPQHNRTRSMVGRAFTPGRVNAMAPAVQKVLDGLFDAFQDKGRFEAFADLAVPLPILVVADSLGIPSSDYRRFKTWSDAINVASNQTI